jgi:FtsZ-binding cell division protein ZapB
MYELKSISEFINEASNISKIRIKLAKAVDKIDSYQTKSRAASEEVNYRKEQLDYEQTKERLRRERDAAQTPVDKAKASEELTKLKKDWKSEKKGLTDRIKSLRKSA